MKKNCLMLLLGGAMLMPTTMMAQPEPKDQDPGQHRSPAHSSYVYIAYDGNNCFVNVEFLTAIPDVEIIIYQNRIEVDNRVCQKGFSGKTRGNNDKYIEILQPFNRVPVVL